MTFEVCKMSAGETKWMEMPSAQDHYTAQAGAHQSDVVRIDVLNIARFRSRGC